MKPLFKSKPSLREVDPHRIHYNVGCMMDIPTGNYVIGQRGESILNGGISTLTGIIGKGNTFKSTIMHYMMLSASTQLAESGHVPHLSTYDTEGNVNLPRLNKLAQTFPVYKGLDLHHETEDMPKIWSVTEKSLMLGDEWWDEVKKYLREEKLKNAKAYTLDTPFMDKDGNGIRVLAPTFAEVDSLSEYETSSILKMQNDNAIGESGANTLYMRGGLDKTRLLGELPAISNLAAHYTLVSAHVGKNAPVMQGPINVPIKDLQHMKQDEKIKKVSPNFFFLTTAVWQCVTSTILRNQGTKGPEFPITRDRPEPGSPDLNLVHLKIIRNKNGESGATIPVVVSQSEGVQPSLSEYYSLKTNTLFKKYGLGGNDTTFHFILYPKVNLMRTTIRNLINTDPILRKAIKFTSDLFQIQTVYKDLKIEVPAIEDLYAKIEEEYGWDNLWNTRDYFTFNQYDHPVPFLSAMDLLRMYHGLYTPYWWKGKPK